MKKMLIALAFVGLSTQVFANDVVPEVRISVMANAKKFSLELNNIQADATTVTLYDTKGIALIREKAGEKTYGKVFNLANLPAGSYELVITTSNRDIVQPLELTAAGVEMNADKRKVYFAPTIVADKANLDISYFRGKITSVEVAIYQQNELVFEEQFDNIIKMERRYDLSSLPKGTYNVIVSTDYKKYYREFTIK